MRINNCYLCGGSDFNLRDGTVRDDSTLTILECVSCGLVLLNSHAHIQNGHYECSGMHDDVLPISMESWLQEASKDDNRRFEMVKSQIVGKRVLDFGCGAAGFLIRARELASDVAGVELEKRVREYWNDKLHLFRDLNDANDVYDLITSFHVIEHLLDPRSVLKKLRERLRSGGRLIVEVPSSEDVLLTLYGSDAFQRFTYWSQHLYLFNMETLRRLCIQAGFHIVSIQQFQRYPLSNHLYWLSQQLPGGHKNWSFLDTPELTRSYAASLAAIGKCDTIIAYLEKDGNETKGQSG